MRYDGAELTSPIRRQAEISSPVPNLLRQVDEVLNAIIAIATEVTIAATETKRPDYPVVALRQVARNAVLYHNYETSRAPVRLYRFADRVEIHSPSGPFGQVHAEHIGRPGITDYRHPLRADATKSLGYVPRFGMGFELARRELERNGNPNLAIQCSASSVLVTLRRRV